MNNRDALTFFLNISKTVKHNQILIEEPERTRFFTSINIWNMKTYAEMTEL